MNVTDRIRNHTHNLPTAWLMATLVPHMFAESGWVFSELDPATNLPDLSSGIVQAGDQWWCCALLEDGKMIERFYPNRMLIGGQDHTEYAHKVVRFLNIQSNYGGAWMAAWFGDWMTFYLCWRDKDGDIQITMPCDQPWIKISKWAMSDWGHLADDAHTTWKQFQRDMDWSKNELVKAAQGERQH